MTPIVTALMGFFILSTAGLGQIAAADTASPQALNVPTYHITLTGYNAVPGQTDDDPMTTASGAYSNPSVVAARSGDLADELPYGTVIEIEGPATSTPDCGYASVGDDIGLRVIADAMNPRMHNKIDVLFDTADMVGSRNAASALGFCRGVTIRVVGHIDVNKMPKNQAQLVQMLRSQALAAR